MKKLFFALVAVLLMANAGFAQDLSKFGIKVSVSNEKSNTKLAADIKAIGVSTSLYDFTQTGILQYTSGKKGYSVPSVANKNLRLVVSYDANGNYQKAALIEMDINKQANGKITSYTLKSEVAVVFSVVSGVVAVAERRIPGEGFSACFCREWGSFGDEPISLLAQTFSPWSVAAACAIACNL